MGLAVSVKLSLGSGLHRAGEAQPLARLLEISMRQKRERAGGLQIVDRRIAVLRHGLPGAIGRGEPAARQVTVHGDTGASEILLGRN